MTHPKVVLAYSGGLDTSACVAWLRERGWRVVAFCADLGQGEDFAPIRRRALALGAEKVVVRDLKAPFAREFVLPALQAGAVYEGKYLLATALGRPLIARALVETARAEKAQAVAHGCTGKGNDQVRIEVSCRILHRRLKILAPVREWELKSRPEELRYLKSRGLPTPPAKSSRYSIDQNLWGCSIESGPLEDPWVAPAEGAYQWTRPPAKAPAAPRTLLVDFQRGIPMGLNDQQMPLVRLIQRLNRLGAEHGIGRTDLVEDRLVGIKSREIYEAPAATLLYAAHQELERLTLDRETLAFKAQIAPRYARLVYDGLWFTPLKSALDAFIAASQRPVTGTVRLRLSRGGFAVNGRRSPHSRYTRGLATYEGKDLFDQKAAAGFITLFGLPYTR